MQNKLNSPMNRSNMTGFNVNKAVFALLATLVAIVLGLLLGLIVMIVAQPGNAIYGFSNMLFGGFRKISEVFYLATPILMTGLSVGFAFKMGLFNIGASGQYTMGMFFSLLAGFMLKLPAPFHWIVCILAGMVGGMLWGFIPGILKALANVNEVITSIMFNYIGMYLVDMLIQGSSTMYVSNMVRTAYLPQSAQIPSLGVRNSSVNISIIIAIVIAIVLFIILNQTIFGYELKATGFNKHASKYAGMNDKRNTILTMLIAGGLSGLGGAFFILAPATIAGSSVTYEPINVIAANGFNGIAVALLGSSNPIGIIFSAVFISHIQRGGSIASYMNGYKPEIIDIVIAVTIYFAAFAMLVSANVEKMNQRKRIAREELSKVPPVIPGGPGGLNIPNPMNMEYPVGPAASGNVKNSNEEDIDTNHDEISGYHRISDNDQRSDTDQTTGQKQASVADQAASQKQASDTDQVDGHSQILAVDQASDAELAATPTDENKDKEEV